MKVNLAQLVGYIAVAVVSIAVVYLTRDTLSTIAIAGIGFYYVSKSNFDDDD